MPPTKKEKKRGNNLDSYNLTNEELDSLRKAVELVESARERKGISYDDILRLLIEEKERIPATIFTEKLSSLESISRWLKDELGLNYHGIAVLLGRDERNIWHSYNNSLKKHPEKLSAEDTEFYIPLKIFAERKLSILESIAVHLRKEHGLSFKKISVLVKRDQRTVWTAHSRALKKLGEGREAAGSKGGKESRSSKAGRAGGAS